MTTTEPAAVGGAHGPAIRGTRSIALFAALAFALSPLLVDLARHIAREPWALYAAVFVPLLAAALARERESRRAPWVGGALVAGALGLEIAAVGGGILRFGRPAVPLAVMGLARALGLGSWRTVLLAAWIVPVPHFVLGALGAPLVETWAGIARAALGAAGLELALLSTKGTPALVAPAGALPLPPEHGGVALAAFLSGLGWWAGLRAGARARRCVLGAALGALVALPLQLLAVVLAAAALAAGLGGLAPGLLALGPWVAGATLAILRLRSEWRAPEGV